MDYTSSIREAWELENAAPDVDEGIFDWPAELVTEFPETYARCQQKDGHLHDSLKDTTRLRKKRRRPFMNACERLMALVGEALIFCTVELPDFEGRPLYSKKTINAARRRAKAVIQASGGPGVWKLERGLSGLYHLHLILAAGADVSGIDHWEEVDDLEGLASYLSKPADARACKTRPRSDDLTADIRRRQLSASEEYLTTRRAGARYTFHGKVGL